MVTHIKVYLDAMKGYIYKMSKLKRVKKIAFFFLQYTCNAMMKKEQDAIIKSNYEEKKEVKPVDFYLERLHIIMPFEYYKIDKNPFELVNK